MIRSENEWDGMTITGEKCCDCIKNKATAAAVISRLRISNNRELKEM